MKGTVKWFNINKKFGYIIDEDGNDVFVHASGIEKGKGRMYIGFNEGDEVEFEITNGKKGPQATEVALVKNAR